MAELIVNGSSSAGNQYVIRTRTDCLLLEAGLPFKTAFRAVYYDTNRIKGCLISHRHGDHAKYAEEYTRRKYPVIGNQDLAAKYAFVRHVEPLKWFRLGEFRVLPFEVPHDVQNYGYLIRHREFGNLFFATDTYAIPYLFNDIKMDWWMIEANYSDILVMTSTADKAQKQRLLTSHMSVDYAAEYLQKCDLSKTMGVVLIHLSDRHSDAEEFKRTIESVTHRPVTIADRGVQKDITINL